MQAKSNFERTMLRYSISSVSLSAPQLSPETTLSKFKALVHLVFRFFMCGMNESLLSNMTPKNLCSFFTGISFPLRYRAGSSCTFFWLQKCTQTVLVSENLNPFWFVHFCRIEIDSFTTNGFGRKRRNAFQLRSNT